ncbi:MAG: tRNA glutamyl-Q(34) synthetase GluQRS [Propionibacteriaceae bacterium]|nr:tRNA glutamyl-Q(34) synthetase GluQRS [Micropruina sp.]HBX82015.1 tRNA glutamyl-Q(34) synthetase GluQRS [Propionibacteriaceae bacterium]HBY24186.1 tRNA glutamyl-Q(34) synthetase GluQRS [Propionibacteriaceae bacterium]
MTGRFAPTPTSELHLGNVRTALIAWLMARREGGRFLLRIEDLDTQRMAGSSQIAARQEADLAWLGLTWDGEVMLQSRRANAYAAALESLQGRAYECFCTRRDIAEAAVAPHGDGYRPYPGTCRELSAAQRAERRGSRPAALRIKAAGVVQTVNDLWAGDVTAVVDDFVLVRNDGTPAYNLAVVVDDLAQGVDQVVRGDDLLSSAPRQAWLTRQLGGEVPRYAHVPLAVNPSGRRLAKREGDVTLAQLRDRGWAPEQVVALLAHSLELARGRDRVRPADLLEEFAPTQVPRSPWVVDPDVVLGTGPRQA